MKKPIDVYKKLAKIRDAEKADVYKKISDLIKQNPPYTEEELKNHVLSDEDKLMLKILFPSWNF